jgi:hypothetical protein
LSSKGKLLRENTIALAIRLDFSAIQCRDEYWISKRMNKSKQQKKKEKKKKKETKAYRAVERVDGAHILSNCNLV